MREVDIRFSHPWFKNELVWTGQRTIETSIKRSKDFREQKKGGSKTIKTAISEVHIQ